MTKHWPEQRVLAPPAPSHLGQHLNHHLDFHRDAQTLAAGGVKSSSPVQHWHHHPALMVPQNPGATAFMDKPAAPGPSGPDGAPKPGGVGRDPWSSEQEKRSSGKKKNYQRYPKPPYSYLAMIAMVIQRSPEKKLTLSEVSSGSTSNFIVNNWKKVTFHLVQSAELATKTGWFQ